MANSRSHLELLHAHLRVADDDAPVQVLSTRQRRNIVDAFRQLIEGLYCHLPQKRASYGFDPLQQLRLLGERVGDTAITDAAFHREMAQIIAGLRDAHTRYLVPQGQANDVAFLPLLVERYVDEHDQNRFIAAHVLALDSAQKRAFSRAGFGSGVEIVYWNGRPIERAVDLYAENETGGRPDARRARALESLTIRPTKFGLAPDEHWVDIGFVGEHGEKEIRLNWSYATLPAETPLPDGSAGEVLAFNPVADSARQVKKMLFASKVWIEELDFARDRKRDLLTTGDGSSTASRQTASQAQRKRNELADPRNVQSTIDAGWGDDKLGVLTGIYGAQVYAREIEHEKQRYGYLRIHSGSSDMRWDRGPRGA